MSHFLARLVERARGAVPRAEPIITPRFAPAPIAESATEIEAPTPVRSRKEETVSQNEALTQKTVRQEIRSSRTEEVRLEKAAGPPASPELLLPQKILVAERPEPVVRRIAPEEITAAPVDNGTKRERVTPARGATQPGSPIPAPNLVAPIVATGTGDLGQLGAVSPGPLAPVQPNELHVEPPIVRVTIGRIEVRATPAPRASVRKSTATAAPKLSLDAYLKERKEGRR
jgi:hypothetical protein